MTKKIFIILITGVLFLSTSFTLNNDKFFEIAKNLEIFTSIYKELNTHYVDELDPNTVMRTGIDAIMNSLDPYTVYYSESQVESYRLNMDDRYNGLGASSSEIDGKVTVVEVYKDGPCFKAGVLVGDQILSINGSSTDGRSYEDVMTFMRGYPGTSVQLGIYRPAEKKEYSFDITRSEIDVPNVPYYGMLNESIGYISLSTFTRDAGRNIASALRALRKEHALEGLVLDLRENGGGLLSEAIDILGIFLPKESHVVSTKGKVRDRDQLYSTRRTPIDTELPLAVLINKNSASASEIVSGAIQDYDRGLVLGQRSYGKGLVQNQKEVGYNSRIKITTSKYYIPSGRCIQSVEYENGEPKDIPDDRREVFRTKNGRPVLDGGGVTPDVKISLNEEPEVVRALMNKHWIFHYVNDYIKQNSDAPPMDEFVYTDYDDFTRYLVKNDFAFETEVESALKNLRDKAKDMSQVLQEINSINSKVSTVKEDDLIEFKGEIIRQIEIELAKRYYFQEGKTFVRLKNDPEVEEAISLLEDPVEYRSILQ